MNPFTLSEFLAPLEWDVLLMAFILGLGLGYLFLRSGGKVSAAHLFWRITVGMVFFIPLSIVRALDNSPVWERFLATFVLWTAFTLGTAVAPKLRRPRP